MAPKLGVDIHSDAQDLTVAAITFSGSGVNAIIAGVSGQIIRIYKIFFLCTAATSITFQDGAANLSGAMAFSANAGMILDFDTKPWFVGSMGNAFNLNSSNAVQVSGTVYYTQGN